VSLHGYEVSLTLSTSQALRRLRDAGVLAYTIPEVPNHPHQAYRAVDGTGETT